MLLPSRFACTSPEVEDLQGPGSSGTAAGGNPGNADTLTPGSTSIVFYVKRAQGPIPRGRSHPGAPGRLCQDFAHTMIAIGETANSVRNVADIRVSRPGDCDR